MSYNIHIPIDDISEADIEKDLEEISRLKANYKPPSAPILESRPSLYLKANFLSAGEPHVNSTGSSKKAAYLKKHKVITIDRGNRNRIRTDTNDNELRSNRVEAQKEGGLFTDLDLALARSTITDSKDTLLKAKMRENLKRGKKERGPWGNESLRILRRQNKHKQHNMETAGKNEETLKRIFVNSLRKDKEKKLKNAASTIPPRNRDLQDLMSELKSLNDIDENASKMSAADISEKLKIDKAMKGKLENSEDGVEGHKRIHKKKPKGKKKKKQKQKAQSFAKIGGLTGYKAKGGKTATGGLAQTNKNATESIKDTVENTVEDKDKRKDQKDKSHIQQGYRTQSEIDNRAVAKMVELDRLPPSNRTVFHFVDKGIDRVDLPLSDSAGAWRDKIHGRRDIVVAGSLVMCLGLIVIMVSLFALVRRRFLNSTRRRKTNLNNNKGYRSLGSASETEILRKPKRSLFPLESSEEDDDDEENTSSSEEETVYHQRKINRSF